MWSSQASVGEVALEIAGEPAVAVAALIALIATRKSQSQAVRAVGLILPVAIIGYQAYKLATLETRTGCIPSTPEEIARVKAEFEAGILR
jgi:hypothetical protein